MIAEMREVGEPGKICYRITCPRHDLDRTVDNERHVLNIYRLHARIDHPNEVYDPQIIPLNAPTPSSDRIRIPEVNLTAAARKVLDLDYCGEAVEVWEALTGLADDEAMAYARQLAEDADRTVRLYFPPF